MDDQRKMKEGYNQREEIDLYQLIADTWKNLRRLWWMVILLVLIGAAGVFGFQHILQTPMYESSATFTVATGSSGSRSYSFYYDNSTADQMSKTFPYILESSYFCSVLTEKLESSSINGTITAETISNSNVVTMKVQSPDPQDAYDILTAAIEVYPETAYFVLGNISFEMLTEASIPSEPCNQYGKVKSLLMGACGGLFIAVTICGLLALFIKNVRSTEEMKKITSVRCMAHLPKVRFKARSKTGDTRVFISNKGLSGEYNESIRVLLTRVLNSMNRNHGKVLLITSTIAGEGKSVTAANLAYKLGKDGNKVLLVDGDLRKQSDGELLGVKVTFGLSDVRNTKSESEALEAFERYGTKLEGADVWILENEKKTDQPAPVLSSKRARRFLDTMRNRMDYIIIDSPPCTLFQDASILAEYADEILYVVKYDKLPSWKIRDGLKSIGNQKAVVSGYILNECPEMRGGYGYGRYGYGKYSYGKYGYGKYGYGHRGYGVGKEKEEDQE